MNPPSNQKQKPPTAASNLQTAADQITAQRKQMQAINRQVANATWTDKSLSPAERQLFTDMARSLGLNPALGHTVILGGNLYITRAGLMHKLNQAKVGWSIENEYVYTEDKRWEWWAENADDRVCRARVKVWEWGKPDQSKENSEFTGEHKKKIKAPQMAKKRAEHRALRGLLEIDIPSVDEIFSEQFIDLGQLGAGKPLGDFALDPAAEKPQKTLEAPSLAQQVINASRQLEMPFEKLGKMLSEASGRTITSAADMDQLSQKELQEVYDLLTGGAGDDERAAERDPG
jgi:hypothetical protein